MLAGGFKMCSKELTLSNNSDAEILKILRLPTIPQNECPWVICVAKHGQLFRILKGLISHLVHQLTVHRLNAFQDNYNNVR